MPLMIILLDMKVKEKTLSIEIEECYNIIRP